MVGFGVTSAAFTDCLDGIRKRIDRIKPIRGMIILLGIKPSVTKYTEKTQIEISFSCIYTSNPLPTFVGTGVRRV